MDTDVFPRRAPGKNPFEDNRYTMYHPAGYVTDCWRDDVDEYEDPEWDGKYFDKQTGLMYMGCAYKCKLIELHQLPRRGTRPAHLWPPRSRPFNYQCGPTSPPVPTATPVPHPAWYVYTYSATPTPVAVKYENIRLSRKNPEPTFTPRLSSKRYQQPPDPPAGKETADENYEKLQTAWGILFIVGLGLIVYVNVRK